MATWIKRIAGKLLTGFIWIRHSQLDGPHRYFLRSYYLGHISQVKFLWKDKVVKKPYKVIAFNGEFQQELLYVIPYAYWHYKNGTLLKTISSNYTKDLYFFSPNHEERFSIREWESNQTIAIPHGPHNHKINYRRWSPIPYKKHYHNKIFSFDKPIIVIANRYNTEWGKAPISFFSLSTLKQLVELLKDQYQIIYNRPQSTQIVDDNSKVKDLGDYDMLSTQYPEVIVLPDFFEEHRASFNNYNHCQIMAYAMSDNFISIHGGTATLASMFGGKNIIFSKKGHEHQLKEFENVFSQLSGAQIIHCKTEADVITSVMSLIG